MNEARELNLATGSALPEEVRDGGNPVILRRFIRDWPAVAHCAEGVDQAREYLSNFWIDQPVTAFVGALADGRFFYNDKFDGFNFKSGKATLNEVFERLSDDARAAEIASIYVGSTPIDQWLPGFREKNDVELGVEGALASFWVGSATRISAHYDFPDNLACVVAGKRRFTLFPPEQIGNLYVGPLDVNPAGQAISLVDFSQPDFDRFPKFRDALEHALVCDLEPGDALFIPSMWWHHVEAHNKFNLLVNYWWCESADYLGAPAVALFNAILSLRDLPEHQRDIWRGVFDHYVFGAKVEDFEHIPEQGRGILAPLDETQARKLRALIQNRLNQ